MKRELGSVCITRKTPKEYALKLASDCKKCGHCCSYGSGIFLDEDIRRISKSMGISEDEFKKKHLEESEQFNRKIHKARIIRKDSKLPFGKCSFYEDGHGCQIHDIKPLHCRVGNGCSEHGEQLSIWFTLNYLVDEHDPESVRQWAAYLRTHPAIPGGELHELVPDKEKLDRILSYELLR